jgi:dihydrofolate synthase/folylpolyglutamate synthase
VADGAHNIDGATALAAWLAEQPRPETRILLWGMNEGRDSESVIAPLLPHVDEVVTTRCAHPRAADPMSLALALQDLDVVLAAGGDIEETLPEVYAEAHETLVAGSLFLAGAARSLVRDGALAGLTPGERAGADVEGL